MGSLRTRSFGAVLSAMLFPVAADATDFAPPPQDQLHFFATCAGRLSAIMEHQWMFDGPGSDITLQQNRQVVAILDAIRRPDQGAMVLGWRIEAKVAHRALLSSAVFAADQRLAEAARKRAESLIAPCRQMMLG